MAVVGSASVQLIARTGNFVRGMGRARKSVRDMGDSAKRVSKVSLPNLVAGFAAVAAGAAGFIAIFRKVSRAIEESVKRIDLLAKTSKKIGISTEALSGLQFAAARSGVQANTFNMALQRMTRRLSEAALGTGEAVNAFKELGINALALSKLPLESALGVIADAMKGVGSQADRVRLSFKLFDSEGVALVTLLNEGSEGIAQLTREAATLGAVIGTDTAAAMEELADQTLNTKTAWEDLANAIAESTQGATSAIKLFGQETAGVLADLVREFDRNPLPFLFGAGGIAFTELFDREGIRARQAEDQARAFAEAGFSGPGPHIPERITPDDDSFVIAFRAKQEAATTKEQRLLVEAFDDSRRVIISMRTPLERYEAQLRKVNLLQMQGVFSAKEYASVIEGLKAKFDAALNPAKDLGDEVGDIAVSAFGGADIGRLAPTFAAGSVGAQQAAFKAQSQQQGMINVLTDILRNSQQRKVTDATRNTLLSKLLAAEENKPLITIS